MNNSLVPFLDPLITGEFQPKTHDTCITQRYLGDSLGFTLKLTRCLGVLAPYGNGKTTAIKNIIRTMPDNARILFITPRKSLNVAIAGSFSNINCYLDIKKETDINKKVLMIRSMSCTPQSLVALLKQADNYRYDLVVIDEVESVASMFVSDVTKEKEATLLVMQRVVNESEKVVLMDANYSDDSELLAKVLSGIPKIPRLINTYQPWARINATVLSGATFKIRTTAINMQILESIAKRERIFIAASSASYADAIYKIIIDTFPYVITKLATSKTDNTALVSNPDSESALIDVLVYSPSLSVGVSFDIKNRFHKVFGIFSNEMGTPDQLDAMQEMCRLRNPSLNKWVIVLDDRKQIYQNGESDPIPSEIATLFTRTRIINSKYATGNNITLTDTQCQLLDLYSNIHAHKIYNKNNYNKLFMGMLYKMGVQISFYTVDAGNVDLSIQEAMRETKAQAQFEKVESITFAPKLTDTEATHLQMLKKHGHELTPAQAFSLERNYIEASFDVDFDEMNKDQVSEIFSYKESDYILKAVKRAQLFASSGFDKKYTKARLLGLDNEKESFKVEITDKHNFYLLLKKLYQYAIPYIDGKEYSHKTLNRSAFFQWVSRRKRELNIIRPNFVKNNFKAKPALLMNQLLEDIGYGHSTKRQGNGHGKKQLLTFKVKQIESFELFYDAQLRRGDNWLESTRKLMDELELVREVLTKDDIRRLQMPLANVNFAKKQILRIPQIFHKEVMTEYLFRYDMMNDDNPYNIYGMETPIYANKWLKSQADIYDEKGVEFS
jgi:hypothetical protein